MKICLIPHPNTTERFSYLISTLHNQVEIAICFPEEDPIGMQADLFILEEDVPDMIQRLLSMENPPPIVITKNGLSNSHIRYLPNFTEDFPKFFKHLKEREPVLLFRYQNEYYSYLQKDILLLTKTKDVTIQFRQGNQLTYRLSFNKLAKQLSKQLFFPVGEDYFVNAEYVYEITSDSILMQNGQKLSFGAETAEQIKNAYFKTKFLRNYPAS